MSYVTSWDDQRLNRQQGGGRMSGPIEDDLYFDLAGKGVQAQLTTGGPAGLKLDLELEGKRHAFGGDQIAVKTTGIGALVTVVVERVAESHQTDFSLLIPTLVVDPQFNDPERVKVVTLRTRHDAPPLGPFPPYGVFQRHTVFELSGTATLIKYVTSMPCARWSAVETSGGVNDVIVSGTCEVPRLGYTAWLQRAAWQGRDPKDLRLQLMIREPTKPTPGHPTAIQVQYQELTCDSYKTVTILPDDVSIPVQYEEGPWAPPSRCNDWTVTLDPTSDPDKKFELNIAADCPAGEFVELQPVNRGNNPKDLYLQETFASPTAPAGEAPRPTRIQHKLRTGVAYTRVIILPGGPCLPVTRHHSILDR